MTLDEIMASNPNISPEKLALLKAFSSMPAGGGQAAMLQKMKAFQSEASKQNLQFTSDEQQLLFQLLTQNLSPQEKAKVDQMMMILNRFGKK